MDEVPLPCLLSTCCLVSRAWRDIISNPLYLPWAKRYYAYKLRRQGAECAGVPPAFIVQAYLDHFFKEVGAAEEDVLPGLISHIGPDIKIKDSVFSGITNPLYLPWANEQKSKEAKLSSTKLSLVG